MPRDVRTVTVWEITGDNIGRQVVINVIDFDEKLHTKVEDFDGFESVPERPADDEPKVEDKDEVSTASAEVEIEADVDDGEPDVPEPAAEGKPKRRPRRPKKG